MDSLDAVRLRYIDERPKYERLSRIVSNRISEETRSLGLPCTVDHRAKEVSSLLKKILRKGPARESASPEDSFDRIRDKAGARASVMYKSQLPRIRAIVERSFEVLGVDDKSDSRDLEKFGYRGVHYQISATEALVGPSDPDLISLECEIQLHSVAQSLWAAVAHELSYKPSQEAPEGIQRMIYRLAALLEIFDEEALRARTELLSQPGFSEAALLDDLESQFYRFTGKAFDRALSLQILDHLRPLWDETPSGPFRPRLEAFVEQKQSKLSSIFSRYKEDDRHLLLSQPESLLILLELETDKLRLETVWVESLPIDLLSPLADVWGVSLDAA